MTLADKRKLFNEELRERGYYPKAAYPADCYIFDMVLGIDPRQVAAYAGTVSRTSYQCYVLDPDGNRVQRKGGIAVVTRKFTPEQRKALREWYPLLSDTVRA